MPGEERALLDKVRAAVERRDDPDLGRGTNGRLRAVSLVARDLLALDAAVVVTTAAGDLLHVVGSDASAETLARLELTTGEGPVRTAVHHRRPSLCANLSVEGVQRWPGYSDAAVRVGARAVFAVPLAVGAAVFGGLQLTRRRTGDLDTHDLRQAIVVGQVAAETLLDDLDEHGPGSLLGAEAVAASMEVYQAQGMVMVALGVDLDEALVRMRAHAFSHGIELGELARDIVNRRVRLDHD